MGRKAFKFYIRPTKDQASNLDRIRAVCCELYNAALENRKDAYRKQGVNINYVAQSSELTSIKSERVDVSLVYSQILQDTLKRLHRAFDAFFRRVKNGEKPGYPRFRSLRRYDSFTFPQVGRDGIIRSGGVDLVKGRLKVHGIPGTLKVKWHRQLQGRPKTATFKREGDRWYVIFSCDDVPSVDLPSTGRECGVDLGLTTFAVLDNCDAVANPRFLKNAEAAIRHAQRRVSRKIKRSNRREKARRLLAKQHRHIANSRRDFSHKTAKKIIKNYDRIAVENLNVKGLARGMLSKSVHDAGWGMFLAILKSKAANAGREVVEVDPAGTSQECSDCGVVVRKNLDERVHRCVCGLVLDRDVNAARNIRARAFEGPGNGLRRGQPEVRASNDPKSL